MTASVAGAGAVTSGSPVQVTFTAGAISVAATGPLLSGTDMARVADGTSVATLSLQLKDALGNNVTEAGVAVTFSTTRGALSSTGAVTTNASGVATVTLTSTERDRPTWRPRSPGAAWGR